MNSLHLTCPSPSSYLRRASHANATPFLHLLHRINCPSESVGKAISQNPRVASVAAVSREEPTENSTLLKGDMWSIHKFGGTCMGTSERIQSVANIVLGDPSERKLVVVSAMSKVTDMMYNLVYKAQSRDDLYLSALDDVYDKHMLTAKQLLDGDDIISFLSQLHNDITNLKAMLRAIYIAGHAIESFSDFVVGHGELWSAQMLSYVVRKCGMPCSWMDTREVLIVKPAGSNQVDPDYLESEKRLEKWFSRKPADIIIATGFIASTPQNIPTTLKRDGSDFSAAIMGALVKARQVTIWTDVDGVFSADPRKVSEAVILRTLSYQEAWEMSYFGANVLHPRTIIPVMKDRIPIVIRNIFNLSAPGTMICEQPVNENGDERSLEACVKAFATIDNLALVNVEGTGMAGVPGTASAIFGTVKEVGANVIMISQASSEHSVCFAVPEKEVKAVSDALEARFRQALDAGRLSQVEVIHNCSILAAVGQKMASTPGVCATLFDALAKANINVRAIAQGCTEYNITVVLKQEDCVRALRAAHSRFSLSKTTLAMGIIGPGLIGGTLLDQLRDRAAVLKETFNIDLRVMGITGSRTMILSESQALLKSSCSCKSQRWMCYGSIRISCFSERVGKAISKNPHVASVAAVSREEPTENSTLLKGDMWSIHKFGGTCMGTSERIQSVANIVLGDPSERKLVVVSAMSKVTDMMYNLVYKAQSRDDSYLSALDDVYDKHMLTAKQLLDGDDIISFLSQLHDDITNLKAMLRAIYIAGHATESFSDFVVGHGELWSAQMLSYVVRKCGMPCSWMDTREVLIVKPAGSNQVDPDYLESEKRLEKWFSRKPADIIIATGFIASTPQNIPTTLKRDGSDFSAAIMGALVKARQVTIWTDVDGVFSADPRKVSEAVILRTLSYQEAWEMSYFGANVLHPRTIIPVMKDRIPIVIRNIFNLSAPGTMICEQPVNENGDERSLEACVKAFATIDDLALVNVEGTGMAGVPGTASAIFGTVKEVGANVIMISQASSEHSVCFAVPEKEVKAVSDALEARFRQALDAGRLSQVEVIHNCSILAAVGQKMASTPGVSATLFDALAKANINVRAIAQGCTEYNITVVLKQEDCVRALRAAHSRFYLSKTTLAMGIIGPGLIGGTLLDQLRDQAAVLKETFNIDLRVMGITGSRTMILSESGIDLTRWRELQKEKAEAADLGKFALHVHENHFFPNTVLVDCTSDSNVANHYYDWLCKGIHVITPNKKANSGPLDRYLKLRAQQRKSYTHYFYEATVGAGLPIISTLHGLLETGDKIQSIEGIFSGTLSYIFNNFKGTRTFSEVVAEAKEAGFTEPDPRDDLSGTDVARKVIILARESGMKLELSDIQIANLVPEPLKASSSVEEFMNQLPKYDEYLSKQRDDAETAGEVLRYVGVVDVAKGRGLVELKRYSKDHPFAQLSGSDNIIAFTTMRYKNQPLIVRGPGAGAEVTAGGVFSDILRLASYLGAPS